jgi:hypothetical protein
MALGTITPINANPAGPAGVAAPQPLGSQKVTINTVVLDSSYPTGGSPLTPAQLGLTVVLFVIASMQTVGAGGVSEVSYNSATSKLQAWSSTAEIANATVLSANTAQIVAFGY